MSILELASRSPVTALAVLSAVALVIYLGVKPYLRFGYPAPLPPSPPAEPFVGHWRKLPIENAHLKYMEDAEKLSKPISSYECFDDDYYP